jgi:parvulin-like peptidyl-prolyl isomerase
MAKRRQTTGVPKTRRPEAASPDSTTRRRISFRPLSEYQTRAEREAAVQRLVFLGVGIAVAIIVLVILVAVVFDRVITPSRTVATVNGDTISVSEYRSRVRLERAVAIERINAQINDLIDMGLSFDEAGQQTISFDPYRTLWDELNIPDQIGLRALNEMIDDRLVRAEAEQRGISVTQEDIDEQIRLLFLFDPELYADQDAEVTPEVEEEPTPTRTPFVSPTPSPEPSPTPTPEEEPTATHTPFPTVPPPPTRTAEEQIEAFERGLEEFYNRVQREAGVSREQLNQYFESRALRVALTSVVTEPETTQVWVNSRHILVNTEEEALDIIDALNGGESFAALARALSEDPGSGSQGGELDWTPVDRFVEPFADAAREAPIGQIVGPVQTDFGYHIIQVRAREDREMDEFEQELSRDQALRDWLAELRQREENEIVISGIWPDFVPTDPPFLYRPR